VQVDGRIGQGCFQGFLTSVLPKIQARVGSKRLKVSWACGLVEKLLNKSKHSSPLLLTVRLYIRLY
jgi:hypothetical protein